MFRVGLRTAAPWSAPSCFACRCGRRCRRRARRVRGACLLRACRGTLATPGSGVWLSLRHGQIVPVRWSAQSDFRGWQSGRNRASPGERDWLALVIDGQTDGGRNPEPSAGPVNSQSVKGADTFGGDRRSVGLRRDPAAPDRAVQTAPPRRRRRTGLARPRRDPHRHRDPRTTGQVRGLRREAHPTNGRADGSARPGSARRTRHPRNIDEVAERLYADAAFLREVVFALPFSFDHTDYVQILTDMATCLGPALGWKPGA